ncbi:hypothetical protein GCM10010252_50000 [Streptomyces aureoverticillatus]|nr:hypothetical protein GCM10010252_50000 [Streptomyces aureoverticillatus]
MNNGHMRKWLPAALGVNLLLGIPAVVPVWLLWYLLANWPLAALGWTGREPTENDGVLPWLLLGGLVPALYALLWWLANRPVRRRATVGSRLYWPVSVLATLVPTFVLVAAL